MKVIVLVVTYNGKKWINTCLNSLAQSTLPVDVVVVDNASSDNTLEIVRQYNPSKVICLNQNLGFGKANNVGIKYALEQSADFVFLMNQDAWIHPDTIEELVAASLRNPEYFVISPMHLEGTETRLDFNFALYCNAKNCEGLLADLAVENGRVRDVYETNFVNAALWLIPKACLTQIGGFDPIFYHYGEDNDFTKRVRYHGYKVGICPKAVAVHDRPQKTEFAKNHPHTKTLSRRKTDALIKLKDINVQLKPALLAFYSRVFRTSVKHLLKLNLSELSNDLKLVSFTSAKLMKVSKHRKISKQLEAPLKWLPTMPETCALCADNNS
jgi:GT2 family glycosyltransferase